MSSQGAWEVVEPGDWEAMPSAAPKPTKGLKGIWQDYINLHKSAPGMVFNAAMGTPGALKSFAQHPERIPKTVGAGILESGRFVPSIPPAIADYLAQKELISPEAAARVPHTPFTGRELVGLEGHEKGDIIGEMLGGFLSGGPGSINAAKTGVKAAINPLRPSTFLRGPLSKEELIKNFNAAQGTNTPLGSILDSPNLRQMFENTTVNFPFSGGDQITADIANQVARQGENLLEMSGKGLPIGEPREQIKSAIDTAFQKQQKIKDTMYEPVNDLANSQGFNLELPSLEKVAQEFGSTMNNSPLFKGDPTLKKAFNQLSNYKNSTKSEQLKTLGPDALLSKPIVTHPSIVEAKGLANRLETEAAKYMRSPNPTDHFIAGKYNQAANAIRKDIKEQIAKKGSPELKEAFHKAEKNYAENYSQFLDKDVWKLLDPEANIDNIINDIIKPGATTDKFSRLEKIQNILPDEQKNLIGNAWLKRALDKEGNLDPKQFAQLINKLGTKQFEALFPDKQFRDQLLNYGRLRGMNEAALSRMANPKTGYSGNFLKNLGALLGTTGYAYSQGGTPLAAATLVGLPLLARKANKVITSPKVRESLIKKMIEREGG